MTQYITTNQSADTVTINSHDSVFVTTTGIVGQLSLNGSDGLGYVGNHIDAIVSGTVAGGIYSSGSDSYANNVTINGGGFAGYVSLTGGTNQIVNYGMIWGDSQSSGLVSFNAFGSAGLPGVTGINSIINAGVIANRFPLGTAYTINAGETLPTYITNSGTISTASGVAIHLNSAADKIWNTGTIMGGVDLGDGDNLLKSVHGSIFGDITAGNGSNKIWTGDESLTVTTGTGGDIIHGGSGDDTINSGGGADVMFGGAGDDAINGGDAIDSLKGQDGDDALNGGTGTDYLFGQKGSDLLDSGTSANEADYLYGGESDDVYVLNDVLDICNEDQYYGGSGIDTVVVKMVTNFDLAISTQLIGIFENLTLSGVSGTENLDGTGNALGNIITGNEGANALDGLDGDDLLSGAGGADSLDGGIGDDLLLGGIGIDLLIGGDGEDTLEGGSSADTMKGGKGNDVYRIDIASDTIDESDGTGVDTVLVLTPLVTYSLNDPAHVLGAVERLTFQTFTSTTLIYSGTGNALNNVITGNGGRNKFIGLDGNDTLNGLDGDDILIGGAGADKLLGGNGNDTADYSTSASNLTVAFDGSVADTGDAVGDTFSSIEILTGTNAAAGDTLIGDANANTINGNAGGDILNGRAGDDRLVGGLGSDTITGELGNDRFVYNSVAECGDIITDFFAVSGDNDTFFFARSAFKGDGLLLFSGPVSVSNFITRASDHLAQDGNDFFIYQTDTHQLWYDPTGSDITGDDVLIATLQAGATVIRTDIFLV